MIFFTSSPANTADLLEQEILFAGGTDITGTNGGFEFTGSLEVAYRFCLNSRLASRLLLLLDRENRIKNADQFYEASLQLPWETWLDPAKTFSVTVTSIRCPWLKNSTFGAMRTKDAIVDRIREHFDNERPNVDFDNPDVVFHVHLEQDNAIWYLDFSGRSMHQRSYRKRETTAILKENLAAAVLMRSEWYKTLNTDQIGLLIDPFCGSGTLCIEAAMMATDMAPGLINLKRFAFLRLDLHDEKLWEQVLEEAYQRHEQGLKREITIIGWDISIQAIQAAEENAKAAHVASQITFGVKDFTTLTADDLPAEVGYVVTDPPYGVRMERQRTLELLYNEIGQIFYDLFPSWQVAILCGNKELLASIDMKPNRTNALYNGPLESQLAHYYVFSLEEREAMIERALERNRERLAQPLSKGAQMVFNRLKKNLERLQPIMDERGITSYRLYDADMPEYSAALDFYEGKWVHLQEYAPPPTVDAKAAQQRLGELIDATERALEVEREDIFVKQRREQKDFSQYEKKNVKPVIRIIREHELMFTVNFTEYIDTGIFLDHRPIRKMIMEMAKHKRFLNLFCYTGTATVHAAAGGALSTVSVDASATYLDWAMQNMKMNGFDAMNHFYYRSDCLEWLYQSRDTFDLIFCDPPTFSNSKMRKSFDVQRDHSRLLHNAMRHLTPNGTLIFSTNFRKFSLHPSITDEYLVEDISEQSIDIDYQRNPKIHYCYLIKHKKAIVRLPKRALEKSKPKKIIRRKE